MIRRPPGYITTGLVVGVSGRLLKVRVPEFHGGDPLKTSVEGVDGIWTPDSSLPEIESTCDISGVSEGSIVFVVTPTGDTSDLLVMGIKTLLSNSSSPSGAEGTSGALYDKNVASAFSSETAFPLRSGVSWYISAHFGHNTGVHSGKGHRGTDLACSSGKEVLSVADGVVVVKDVSKSYGNYVVISHGRFGGKRVYTLYAHFSSHSSIKLNGIVHQGDVIGYVGSTGNSTGPHLHLEVRLGGGASGTFNDATPVNSENYITYPHS